MFKVSLYGFRGDFPDEGDLAVRDLVDQGLKVVLIEVILDCIR